MIITSVNNEIVKNTAKLLQKKFRDSEKLFLIEGQKGIEEAIRSNIEIQKIFTSDNDFLANNIEIIYTNDAVLNKISDTKSAPKYIAVAKQPTYQQQMFSKMKNILLLDGIKDAGNLGTIIRTAVAFNIDGIILYGDTVDIYNPKTVRATVGNLWKIPIITINDIKTLKSGFKEFEFIATLPKSEHSKYLQEYNFSENSILMLGSEAFGLSEELKNMATENLTVEMAGSVESLNLSVSASVLMYKMFIHKNSYKN